MKRILRLIFLHLQRLPMKSRKIRPRVCKLGGVNIIDPSSTFIGEHVFFDTNRPENIIIEEGVWITAGCVFLTHYRQQESNSFHFGKIHIQKNVFIGVNSIICKPVTIGENSIIGAGSIITKNIPPNEVWAGNPAHFIKKLVLTGSKK